MEINMKDRLRTLRKEKNVTREELASHLGISSQSVGKWERGEGFPDITLLPAIALYFGVTVDALLDVDKVRVEEKITAYLAESLQYRNAGENEKNLALWERAYKEFPTDCRVMKELMEAINREARYPCPEDEARRIISLGEKILETSTDNGLREDAVFFLCHTYESLGDEENALRYADMGGSMYTTRDDLRASVLTGEEGLVATQEYFAGLITLADLALHDMNHKTDATPAERIARLQIGIDLWKTVFSDGNLGFYAHNVSRSYATIALIYGNQRDEENTLRALEEAARYAVMAANTGDMTYTAPAVNRLTNKKSDNTKNYKGNACNLRLSGLTWQGYDFLRGHPRFRAVIRLLEQHKEG
ncbi:MAG: helix-turn-helix transcriptional regulator [Clostridia bacterium]|nr:helix-turn-helix transcriptional regulator [Clostridia bacterium]